VSNLQSVIVRLVENGLLQKAADDIRLTPRGRLLSNDVFEAFLAPATSVSSASFVVQ
jgi:coproporphyrinogen III oxidase-like Fe-S oxidoreductase